MAGKHALLLTSLPPEIQSRTICFLSLFCEAAFHDKSKHSDSGILESLLDELFHKLYHSIVPSLHPAFSSYAVQTMKGLGGGDDSMLQELHMLSLLLLKRRTVTEALRNQFWLEHKLLFEWM